MDRRLLRSDSVRGAIAGELKIQKSRLLKMRDEIQLILDETQVKPLVSLRCLMSSDIQVQTVKRVPG